MRGNLARPRVAHLDCEAGMATNRDKEINQAFMDAWDAFGDHKSTGFLVIVTAEACKCSYERVIDALEATSKAHETRGGDDE